MVNEYLKTLFNLFKTHVFSKSIQCSRLKSSYEFHFEGLSNFNPSAEGLVCIQDVTPRI